MFLVRFFGQLTMFSYICICKTVHNRYANGFIMQIYK